MNPAHTDRNAHLVGGGIASLAAAVYLVRDGHFPGRNIRILKEAALGGSLEAGGSAQRGYSMRCRCYRTAAGVALRRISTRRCRTQGQA